MKAIGFAGSFDPITLGHLWVIEEALKIADSVNIFIAVNPKKKPMFTPEERARIIAGVIAEKGWQKINIEIVRGAYVSQAAKAKGIEYLIRGIRGGSDFDQEHILAMTNAEVLGGARTIFVMPPRDLSTVSSTFVKSLVGPAGWHWQVDKFLPKQSYQAMVETWLAEEWQDRVGEGKHLLNKILNNYKKENRYYHNISHLVHCFSEMSRLEIGKEDAKILTIAFLYHDAIYKDGKKDILDEEQSADLLQEDAKFVFEKDIIDKAKTLVLATQHSQKKNGDKLIDIMTSIDLAILGQGENIYKQYSQAIRKEYQEVSDWQYKKARIAVLEKILENKIYFNKIFYKLYEEKARININNEIIELKK